MASNSFWCFIGLHDWHTIWDDSAEKVKDLLYPCYSHHISRVCLNCEKRDMRADRYLAKVKNREQRMQEILDKEPQE